MHGHGVVEMRHAVVIVELMVPQYHVVEFLHGNEDFPRCIWSRDIGDEINVV